MPSVAAASPSIAQPPFTATGTDDVASTERRRKLDALLDVRPSELRKMYEEARAPRIRDVEGDLRGRMLAWPMLESRPGIRGFLRSFAGAKGFPWKGKTFKPFGEDNGEGINRVFSDRFRLFRFETSIAKSRAGDFDALQLDYALPTNPPVIRSIEDGIRELEPGLWLGQAYLRTRTGPRLWLYFALARK